LIGLIIGILVLLAIVVVGALAIFYVVRKRRRDDKPVNERAETNGFLELNMKDENKKVQPKQKAQPKDKLEEVVVQPAPSVSNKPPSPAAKAQPIPYENVPNHFIPIIQLKKCVQDIDANEEFLEEEFLSIPKPKAKASYVEQHKPQLKSKQRYANTFPYDHNRVKLEKIEGEEFSDYINASYVDGANGRKYIASQAPKDKTLPDFWRMVWEQQVDCIAMLANTVENCAIKCT
jgi:hypothetical protein